MLSRGQGHLLFLESPALPLTAPPPAGRAGRPESAGEQNPPGDRWHPARGGGRSPGPLPAAPPSPRGCARPSARPARPAAGPHLSAFRGPPARCAAPRAGSDSGTARSQGVWAALVLPSGRCPSPPGWLWAFPSRPTPSAASARLPGSSKSHEGTAESTGFSCTASAKPQSPAQRSPTSICWSKVKSPLVRRNLGDTVIVQTWFEKRCQEHFYLALNSLSFKHF